MPNNALLIAPNGPLGPSNLGIAFLRTSAVGAAPSKAVLTPSSFSTAAISLAKSASVDKALPVNSNAFVSKNILNSTIPFNTGKRGVNISSTITLNTSPIALNKSETFCLNAGSCSNLTPNKEPPSVKAVSPSILPSAPKPPNKNEPP